MRKDWCGTRNLVTHEIVCSDSRAHSPSFACLSGNLQHDRASSVSSVRPRGRESNGTHCQFLKFMERGRVTYFPLKWLRINCDA